jgi:hypothetical protein
MGPDAAKKKLIAGWVLDPVHPTSHVYAKMALNLIEKVAASPTKTDSRKRKRSDESGSGTGTPSGSGPPNPRSARHSEPPRHRSRDPGAGLHYTGNYGSGSRYGSNRNYTPSQYSHHSRG